MKKIMTILLLAIIWQSAAVAQINFLVVSDNGRNGAYLQKPIASLMGQMAESEDFEAVLALGDVHHYMGIESISDPLWMTNFELVYSHPELQIPWYPILGNHEYRGNTQAVIDYSEVSRRWEMEGRYYSKVFEDDGVSVRIVFIDTVPLIDKYRYDKEDYPSAAGQSMDKQLKWLEKELSNAHEDWVVVVGHHPVYAFTDKDESERSDLQKRLLPILERHNVNMYICGHIHNFQHIRPEGSRIDFIVNTSASLSRTKVGDVEGTVFTSGEAGFSILRCDKDHIQLDMISPKGKSIHSVCQSAR